MPALELVLRHVANGIVYSSIIVLGSIGLSLIYSIAGFANFAHGDTMTVGAYATLIASGAFGGLGVTVLGLPLGFLPALLIGGLVAAGVAVLTDRFVYEPLDVGSLGLLITSIGVAYVYRGVIQARFGSDPRQYAVPAQQPIDTLAAIGLQITPQDVAIVLSAVILVTGLHVLLQYTDFGRKMRATADNPELARASGIRTKAIRRRTWVIGAGLAGVGGAFLGLFNQLGPRMGFSLLLIVFAAVIFGGIGSIYGALLGSAVIGLVVQLVPLLSIYGLPIGIEYAEAVAFLIMVAVLLVRPQGIAGEVIEEGEI